MKPLDSTSTANFDGLCQAANALVRTRWILLGIWALSVALYVCSVFPQRKFALYRRWLHVGSMVIFGAFIALLHLMIFQFNLNHQLSNIPRMPSGDLLMINPPGVMSYNNIGTWTLLGILGLQIIVFLGHEYVLTHRSKARPDSFVPIRDESLEHLAPNSDTFSFWALRDRRE